MYYGTSYDDLIFLVIWYLFFFFSSRRRHTRWPRDWSSDVCSSDLFRMSSLLRVQYPRDGIRKLRPLGTFLGQLPLAGGREPVIRSEERRVGKECRSRWSPYH